MLPTQNVSEYVLARIEDATVKIVKALEITGPFNIQYIAKGSDVMVKKLNILIMIVTCSHHACNV